MTLAVLKFREIVMREVPFARLVCPVCKKEIFCMTVKSDGSPKDKCHTLFCPNKCKKPKIEKHLNRGVTKRVNDSIKGGGDTAVSNMTKIEV
jgi:hypothetical protein